MPKVDLDRIDKRVSRVQHGFMEMRDEAAKLVAQTSAAESIRSAKSLYKSDKYQVRMVGVFVLGYVSAKSDEAVRFLRETVSQDGSWQVQEILAQAFNEYAKSLGYEWAMPTIREWLGSDDPNVRRAVTEGLRIWNQRDYFRDRPDVAIELLSKLRGDESEYVRKSVGNALRDISRKEKELVRKSLATWDLSNPRVKFTYGLASKFL